MKTITLLISLIIGLCLAPLVSKAQMDFSQTCKDKIAPMDIMIGTWEGMGYMSTPAGKDSSYVVENIQYKLDKTVIMMEGRGTKKLPDGSDTVVHDALGILSFQPFTKKYQLISYISKGMSTQAKFEIIDANNMVWSFSAGPSNIRYSINIDNGQWTEIGERSADGENWQQFFEMKLKKSS